MAFTLDDYIRYVRNEHPAFEHRVLPDRVLADFASLDQRGVQTLGLQRDRQWLAQSLPIAFALDSENAPGVAGVGTSGGVPAESDGQGGYRYLQETTGVGLEWRTADVAVLVSDTVVASATTTTLEGTGVAWSVNAYADQTVIIVAGTGEGQPPRQIVSNTADTLTITDPWSVTPDGTSLFRIVQSVPALDDDFGVVTSLPAINRREGFLVKLNAQGQPYLDLTTPLVASLTRGVPLPPYQSVLDAKVWYVPGTAGYRTPCDPFTLVAYANRDDVSGFSGYVMNHTLYLNGVDSDWRNVQNIELVYTPILPAFTARTDYCLLPDTALPYMVARGALFAAQRLNGRPNVPALSIESFVAKESQAKREFLGTIGLTVTSRRFRMRPGRY